MTKNSKRLCMFTLFLFLVTFALANRGQRVMSAFDGAAETFRAY